MKHINVTQTIICLGVLGLGIGIGGHLAGHVMFGILMFAGLVALVENVGWIKWIVYKSNVFLDVVFFGLSVLATIYMGVTITGAITVASLIFSLIYAPMIRNKMNHAKQEKVKARLKSGVRYRL